MIPGRGIKILHTIWPRYQTIKQKLRCNKFKEDFKIVHIKKKKKRLKEKKKERKKKRSKGFEQTFLQKGNINGQQARDVH